MRSRASVESCSVRGVSMLSAVKGACSRSATPLGIAHEAGGARILADADEDAVARRPWPGNGVRLHMGEELVVDALGGLAEGELAERRQVARRKIVLERPLGLLGDIDLAFLQALDQVVGRQVDELDRVGAVEDRVRAPFRGRGRRVICATTSFRLSMCWMLSVV